MIKKTYPGYRAYLDGQEYPYIGWPQGFALILSQTNQRVAHCRDCGCELKPGEGIYRKSYSQNGYICMKATVKIILTVGNYDDQDLGFTINILDNIQRCSGDYAIGKYSSQQIADSIKQKEGSL